MKLGLIARADKTGLGYQTRGFYEHLNPDRVMQIDLSILNGQQQQDGWYTGDVHKIRGIPRRNQLRRFLTGLDVVLTAETPYNYELYRVARAMGVKTANQYNAEFFDHFIHDYPKPDMLIAPSTWQYDLIDNWAKKNGVKHLYLHYPIDRDKFPFMLRDKPKFMHIAGKPAAHDRNGTWTFLRAVPDGTVLTQNRAFANQIKRRYPKTRVIIDVEDPADLYTYGNILVMPRRYGGNCLPLNEALSRGMPVIMPDIVPNNTLLPKDWLVPASVTGRFTPRINVDLYDMDFDALRSKIETARQWDMKHESKRADAIAETISWSVMRDKYIEALESLL